MTCLQYYIHMYNPQAIIEITGEIEFIFNRIKNCLEIYLIKANREYLFSSTKKKKKRKERPGLHVTSFSFLLENYDSKGFT